MTVVNPKSISGINSITTGSGSDNLLTIHTSDANNTERVRINSSGDVIVGSGVTLSPDGDVFFTGIVTATSYAGDGSALTGIAATDNVRTGILDVAGVSTFRSNIFQTSGKILKGLTSARGNYGNNTSGVEFDVQIEGTSATAAGLAIVRNSNDANDGGIVLGKTRATSTGGNTVVQAGDDLGNITFAGSDGTTLQFGAEIFAEVQSGVGNDDMPTDLIFKTNGGSTSTAERLRIASDGRITQKGGDLIIDNTNNGYGGLRIVDDSGGDYTVNYIAGRNSGATAHVFSVGGRTQNQSPWANVSQSECARISQRGISFNGETAQANALDDYEEGSWTPSFGNLSTGSVTVSHAKYTKIGRMVFVQGYLTVVSTSNNNFEMTMPFAQVSGNIYAPLLCQTTAGESNYIALRIQNGSTQTFVKDMQANDSKKSYNTLNGSMIMFSGSYESQ